MTRDLRETIEAVRHDGRSRQVRCPAHDDRRASLAVGRGDDGRVLLHCHTGCAIVDVLTAVGLTMADLHEQRNGHEDKAQIIATYGYQNEQGALLYQVCRFAPKDFRQRRPDGAGGWIWSLGNVRRVLFGLPELHGPKIAYVAEGEKDVLALRAIGLVASTNAGGAGKWRDEYAEQLRAAGVESVAILPDNDEPGRAHAETVARSCHAAGLKVKVVTLPDLPHKGDVSDYLDSGHTRDELVTLVKATALYESSTEVAAAVKPEHDRRVEARPVIACLADVRAEDVLWLWPGRLAAGKLALLVGDPGLGKSWITLDIAARVSAGLAWPDGAPAVAPAGVLLLSAEDGLADTIRPRLDALGADVTRVHHLAVLRAGEHERAVQLADTAALELAIAETGARVLTIDPMSAYLGSTDSHRDAEVRGLIAPLAALAERTGVAILGVMHLSKGTQRPAIYRAIGSIGFAAAARIVLAVAADPERDGRRIVAPVKSNLSAPPAALAYTLADGRLTWETEPISGIDVEALLSPALDRQEHREADAWLREALTDGPMLSRDIKRDAEQAGIARRTLFRAKHRLGIEADRVGYGRDGKWFWRLPAVKSATKSPTDNRMALYEDSPEKTADLAGASSKSATSDGVAPNVASNGEEAWRLP